MSTRNKKMTKYIKKKINLINVYNRLLEAYGEQGWWPIVEKDKSVYRREFKNKEKTISQKFEISIGAILTQNTSWNNVNKALVNLKGKRILSPRKIINIRDEDLGLLIKPAGYYNIKAKKLKEFSKFFLSKEKEFKNNKVSREELLQVWGIGRETADSILLYALNKPFFVIDAYTKRISSRLGFIDEKESYDNIQRFFQEHLPEDYKLFNEFHALIVEHAKQHCTKKPKCKGCCLREVCEFKMKP